MALILHAAYFRYKPEQKIITVGEKGRGRHESYIFVGKSLQDTLQKLREERKPLTALCEIVEKENTKILTAAKDQSVDGVLFTTDWDGGFRGDIEYVFPADLEIILKGHVAQGQAGRMGGWDEFMLIARKPTEIFYKAKGRTYGAQRERVIKVNLESPFVEYYEWDEYNKKINSQFLDNF